MIYQPEMCNIWRTSGSSDTWIPTSLSRFCRAKIDIVRSAQSIFCFLGDTCMTATGGIWKGSVWDLYRSCMGSVWDLYATCMIPGATSAQRSQNERRVGSRRPRSWSDVPDACVCGIFTLEPLTRFRDLIIVQLPKQWLQILSAN